MTQSTEISQTDDLKCSVKKAEETTAFPDMFDNPYEHLTLYYCLKHLHSTLKSKGSNNTENDFDLTHATASLFSSIHVN